MLALEENLPRLKAMRRIERGEFDFDNPSQVYDLWMEAFEDEDRARKAQGEAAQRLVDKHCGAMK